MALIFMELRSLFRKTCRGFGRAFSRFFAVKIALRIRADMLDDVLRDLRRPHPFAAERVGFIVARPTRSKAGVVLLASRYIVVPDDGYAEDFSAGAVMNEKTIFRAMQTGYAENAS